MQVVFDAEACLEKRMRQLFPEAILTLDVRHAQTGRELFLELDNGPAHVSQVTQAALAERQSWRHVIPLARYSPQLNRKEPEGKVLKRDHRSH